MEEFESQGTEQGTESQNTSLDAGAETASGEQPGQAAAAQQQLVDLDSLEKFRFNGREMSKKDLLNAVMFQSDYTRKTQSLAEERKYYDNLEEDLRAVKADPSLAAKFKAVYPEKFHKFLGYVTPAQAAAEAQQASQGPQKQQLDPVLAERIERIEAKEREREVAAAEAQLDSQFEKLKTKYPYGDEEAVIARAEALLAQGTKITPDVIERLYKSVHDRTVETAKRWYAEQTKKQKQANQAGKDVASGGGIPGQAPKLPKSIKEASALIRREA